MQSELLLRIKDAETAAKTRVAQAEAEAKAIVADARRQADAILAEGRAQADFAYSSRVDNARKDADVKAKATQAKGQKDAAALRKRYETGAAGATERALKILEAKL